MFKDSKKVIKSRQLPNGMLPFKVDNKNTRTLSTIWSSYQLFNSFNKSTLFRPMFHFYTPGKYQKTDHFVTFSGGIEMKHWREMG